MPALAQIQPLSVSTIRTSRSARTIARLSARISSTRRGSLPRRSASPRAFWPGATSSSSRTRPSAFETAFWATATMSPFAGSTPPSPAARRSARPGGRRWRSPAGRVSGRPRGCRSCRVHAAQPTQSRQFGRCRGGSVGRVLQDLGQRREVIRGVDVEAKRVKLLDGDLMRGVAGSIGMTGGAAGPKGGADRVRRREQEPVGSCPVAVRQTATRPPACGQAPRRAPPGRAADSPPAAGRRMRLRVPAREGSRASQPPSGRCRGDRGEPRAVGWSGERREARSARPVARR